MKIYTKTGDAGETSLFCGGRVSKDSQRVTAYGSVDELNSNIGWVRAHGLPDEQDKLLYQVQNDLFRIGSDLATPAEAVEPGAEVTRLPEGAELFMEGAIDRMTAELPELKNFIVPGGSPPAVALHVTRSVCRRAEREVIRLTHQETVSPKVLKYLNRLSDMLFVMARYMNKVVGLPDIKWEKGGGITADFAD